MSTSGTWGYIGAGTSDIVKGQSSSSAGNRHSMDYAYLNKFSFPPRISGFVFKAREKDLVYAVAQIVMGMDTS